MQMQMPAISYAPAALSIPGMIQMPTMMGIPSPMMPSPQQWPGAGGYGGPVQMPVGMGMMSPGSAISAFAPFGAKAGGIKTYQAEGECVRLRLLGSRRDLVEVWY